MYGNPPISSSWFVFANWSAMVTTSHCTFEDTNAFRQRKIAPFATL